jgi:hypothetical protein
MFFEVIESIIIFLLEFILKKTLEDSVERRFLRT